VYGEGNALDFGARIYDSRLGRWMSVDPQASKYVSLSPFHFGNNNPIITIDPNGEENIVVVGGNTSMDNGGEHNNIYNFIEPAIKQAKLYEIENNNEKTTIIIMNAGYTPEQIDEMTKAILANGLAAPVIINSADELTNYINNKKIEGPVIGGSVSENRFKDKVTDLVVFSHGSEEGLLLGYSTEKSEVGKYDKADIKRLSPLAFGSEVGNSEEPSQIQLYSCFSASTNSIGESPAMLFNEVTGAEVSGYMGRTDYTYINQGTKGKTGNKILPEGSKNLPVGSEGSTEVVLPPSN
jgi:hypothetical protein